MNTISRKRKNNLQRKADTQLLIMCIPTIIKLFVFSYLPLVGIWMAFVNYIPRRGIFGSKFVGFQNFKYFFQSVDFKRIFSNTIYYNLIFIVTGLVFSVVLALLLFEIRDPAALKIYQTTYFLPYFISWVLVGLMLKALVGENGSITKLIVSLGGEKISFYMKPEPWRSILPMVNIWKGAGVSAIIYYATLMNCDVSLYEAADLDGANRIQKMWYISVPYLKTMMCVNTIMSGANILRSDFGLFYYAANNATASNLYETTDVIDTYIWRVLKALGEYKIGTAVGVVQGAIGLILTVFANWIVRKIDEQSALF